MIDLYYWTTPNGHKITMFLEEAKLEYKVIPVNIGKGVGRLRAGAGGKVEHAGREHGGDQAGAHQ